MSRIYKAIATLIVLVALFRPAVERSLPQVPWVILFVITLTYGASLFLSNKLPAYCRLAIAYLAFVGLSYLVAGIFGVPTWGLFEDETWDSLVSPYPFLTLLFHGIPRSPHAPEWAEIYVLPRTDHTFFSVIVVLVSVAAIIAAFAMAKGSRIANRIWLALLGVCILSTFGYVVLGIAGWGLGEAVLPVCWTASYVLAYAFARKGVGADPVDAFPPC